MARAEASSDRTPNQEEILISSAEVARRQALAALKDVEVDSPNADTDSIRYRPNGIIYREEIKPNIFASVSVNGDCPRGRDPQSLNAHLNAVLLYPPHLLEHHFEPVDLRDGEDGIRILTGAVQLPEVDGFSLPMEVHLDEESLPVSVRTESSDLLRAGFPEQGLTFSYKPKSS